MSTEPETVFLSPGDLCERWRIDWKTLNKFNLPWVQFSPRVRRLSLATVEEYERRHRLRASADCTTGSS